MRRIKELDSLRGLITLFVIVIHLTSTYVYYKEDVFTYNFVGILNCALTFVVPCFLFISAMIMAVQAKKLKKINWIEFTSKRLVRVTFALIFWTLVYMLLFNKFENVITHELITKQEFIEMLLTGNAAYHLYFLPIIIQLYVFFPLIWIVRDFWEKNLKKKIKKILKKKKIKLNLDFNLLQSFLLVVFLAALIHYVFLFEFRFNILKKLIYHPIFLITYFLPVILGMWLGINYSKIKKISNKLVSIALIIFSIISGYIYVYWGFINFNGRTQLIVSPIYWCIICTSLLYFFKQLNRKTPFLNKISQHSFIIYLIHPVFLYLLAVNFPGFIIITNNHFINYIIDTVIRFAIVLSASYLVSFVWYKVKYAIQSYLAHES